MKKVYSIQVNTSGARIKPTFYETKEVAEKALKFRRDQVAKNLVTFVEDTPQKFTFVFGWEEKQVSYEIVEFPLLVNVEES
jgi:hypothetical protein